MQKVSLPKKPKYTEIGENLGKIEIEGCFPGYGTTLGNALRRVLLSSLTGSAATSVKIQNVSHEFSTIPGVKEDIIQLILNIKKIRFKSHKDEPVTLTVKEKGAKKITASQIQCPADVEVVNRDAAIAEITDKKGSLEMEIEVQRGLGYVPVEQQEREKREIGLIAIDAIYTPIRRVNYVVENMRVGKRTDFDKITLEIETDGTISPLEAYLEAVKIIIEQLDVIKEMKSEEMAAEEESEISGENKEANLGDQEKAEEPSAQEEAPETQDAEVSTLSFSTRTLNVLEKNTIRTVSDLAKYSEEGLKGLDGMGDKGIKEIKKALGNFGITLK